MSLYEVIKEITEKQQKIIGGGCSQNLCFDLKEKSIRSKRKYILKNGKLESPFIEVEGGKKYDLSGIELISQEEVGDPFETLQKLYDEFIFSFPDKNVQKSAFRPKSSDELTDEQLSKGINRSFARCRLEAFVVLSALCGHLKIDLSHWFYRGENGLIIYKDWVN